MGVASRARYDLIGDGYARSRRDDPGLVARVHAALGRARTVVNVGAGAGSYEPRDRHVIAIEPSDVMARQRPGDLAPAIRASADALPLRDDAVDAAMAVLTVHHWDEGQERGVRELRRVARGPVVIVTFDAEVFAQMWLVRDYMPEVAELDRRTFPSMVQLQAWLGGEVKIEPVLIAADSPDWTLGSFWAHPERVLDQHARAATSGFARMPAAVVDRVVDAVERDLRSGAWDERYGALRDMACLDVGQRLVIANPARPARGGAPPSEGGAQVPDSDAGRDVSGNDDGGRDNAPVQDESLALALPDPALSEETLLLRAWEQRDAEVVLTAGLDTLISRYRYSLPRTRDEAQAWIAATMTDRLTGTRLELAIVHCNIPLGSVSLTDFDHGNAMLRYWLLPHGRGRGLATRAARLLVAWAFDTLRLGRLAAFIEPSNQTSRGVLERCGFVREGLLRQHMTGRDGNRVDTLLYGLIPDDLDTPGPG
jgi:RimJ/RimL family protein N-acetyltransferase/SAM-dependent methyltransferase